MHGNFLPHALRTVQKFGGKLIGKNHTGRTRFRRKKFQGGKNGKVSYEPFWMDQRKTNQASFRTPRFRKKLIILTNAIKTQASYNPISTVNPYKVDMLCMLPFDPEIGSSLLYWLWFKIFFLEYCSLSTIK